jgi:signal transduction histidine kinase
MEERNSLAQNIHDKVGHSIAGSLIQLEAATVMLEKDQEKAKDIIRNVINVLKEGMENIRLTLRNIKPAAEQLGINRLKIILDEFSANYEIRATLSYSGNLDAVKHSYWRIIMDNTKEALTNVLKYSSASAVTVKIEVLNKLVRIEIKDNGIGAFLIKKGLGLHGMEERVENAGGRLIIDGTAGFSVIMLLPVTSSSEGT